VCNRLQRTLRAYKAYSHVCFLNVHCSRAEIKNENGTNKKATDMFAPAELHLHRLNERCRKLGALEVIQKWCARVDNNFLEQDMQSSFSVNLEGKKGKALSFRGEVKNSVITKWKGHRFDEEYADEGKVKNASTKKCLIYA
jgi:hypothetical protein